MSLLVSIHTYISFSHHFTPRVWQHVKLSDVSLGIRPLYSLLVDEKPTKERNSSFHTQKQGMLKQSEDCEQ